MNNLRLSGIQRKNLMDLMEQLYKATITFEASQNSEYLAEIAEANASIQTFLHLGALADLPVASMPRIDELSRDIEAMTIQLNESTLQYFTSNNQELLNQVTEMLTEIENTFID